jgi:hypothetical protein
LDGRAPRPLRGFLWPLNVDSGPYANRLRLPAKGKLTKVNLKRGAVLALNIVWRIGVLSDYRAAFWKAAWHALRRGQIEAIFGMGFVAWHLIQFTQEALGGQQNSSFYASKQYSTRLE